MIALIMKFGHWIGETRAFWAQIAADVRSLKSETLRRYGQYIE